ncbi:MAG TPA: bifunctional hydroxymethylpyrimidine kinase/phosphomethylpyrimidine kinase [Campylobacterales bacterium]|nr:bifunctional hydroxymethylpyrimidine kinase/phosphomethylpyrimidine kinase [Arcobacter sp.]HHB94188.1 bifunctional hydroxymethylpyrimidine kinase/phosphomethylpyrimidine kinase [Campylobacterales bacterium]
MHVVLSIAGSDSSGGAGIQADLKSFEAFNVFGTSALTVLTAQNTQGVDEIYEVSPSFVKAQIEAVLNDFDVKAIKVGMLYSNEIIDVVREIIAPLDVPIVIDPVFISKAGSKLLNDDAVENLKTLFPYATLVTPNRFEARELFDYDFNDPSTLHKLFKLPYRVLIKNETLEINDHFRSVDTLYNNGEKSIFSTPSLKKNSTHGTGCSFASAIASNLALGKTVENAIDISKKFIYSSIKNAPNIGHGNGPIAHKIGGEICQLKES